MIQVQMSSQRPKEHVPVLQGLASGPVLIYDNFAFSIFMRLQIVEMSGSKIVVPCLGLF